MLNAPQKPATVQHARSKDNEKLSKIIWNRQTYMLKKILLNRESSKENRKQSPCLFKQVIPY